MFVVIVPLFLEPQLVRSLTDDLGLSNHGHKAPDNFKFLESHGGPNLSSMIRWWLEEGIVDCGLVDCAMAPSWWTHGYSVSNNMEATEHNNTTTTFNSWITWESKGILHVRSSYVQTNLLLHVSW